MLGPVNDHGTLLGMVTLCRVSCDCNLNYLAVLLKTLSMGVRPFELPLVPAMYDPEDLIQ